MFTHTDTHTYTNSRPRKEGVKVKYTGPKNSTLLLAPLDQNSLLITNI